MASLNSTPYVGLDISRAKFSDNSNTFGELDTKSSHLVLGATMLVLPIISALLLNNTV